jgi:hypothetical protein
MGQQQMSDARRRWWEHVVEGRPYRYSEMLPHDRVFSVLKRISKSRGFLNLEESEAIAKRLCQKVSKRPWLTFNALFKGKRCSGLVGWYLLNGKVVLHWPVKWDELEAEARRNGWQFCSFKERTKKLENRVYKQLGEFEKTRWLINRIKKEITNEDKQHRAA